MEQVILTAGVFVLVWWVAFLALLPVGIRSQEEAGPVEPGTPASAPVNPGLVRKGFYAAGIAVLITAVLFGLAARLPPLWELLAPPGAAIMR